MTPPLAYVTLRGDYSPGAFRQVRESAQVAARERLPFECYWIRGKGSPHPTPPRVHVIEVDRRGGGPGLRLAQYRAVAALARTRPRILLRYPIADPLLVGLMHTRATILTEHHSKEIEELALDQPGRARLERWFGPAVLGRAAGLVAVTREILDYERSRTSAPPPGLVAGNAIDVDGDTPAWMSAPAGRAGPISLLFVASTIQPWHGLDLVLESLSAVDRSRYALHVCGSVADTYVQQARTLAVNATFHGRLDADQLWPIYQRADVGISAFGLHRKALGAASSLKVREYLHAGLPAVLQGADEAFPADFPYVLSMPAFDLDAVERWLDAMPPRRRVDVREHARPYISLHARIERLCAFAASVD